MFLVPGWVVSADSLVQEKAPPSAARLGDNVVPHIDSSDKSHKRKRNPVNDSRTEKISGRELEKLWNKSFGTHEDGEENLRRAPAGEAGGKKAKSKRHEKVSQQINKPLHNGDERPSVSRNEKEKKKHEKKGSEKQNGGSLVQPQTSNEALRRTPNPQPVAAKLTPLQAKMRNKLNAARFRHLNETLYTTSSANALELFTSSPDLFTEYHTGFSQQVKDSWPQNPVDDYISAIKSRGKIKDNDVSSDKPPKPLPRRKPGICTIADLGCGDAPLARGCQSQVKNLKLKFYNFDLHQVNNFVTKSDISNLPLRDGEIDIAVFCLSLMGTNWISFVEEAWRVLRGDGLGEVWVSEVKSRFGRVLRNRNASLARDEPKAKMKKSKFVPRDKPLRCSRTDEQDEVGDNAEDLFSEDDTEANKTDETDVSKFIQVFQRRGFVLKSDSVNKSNKMFVSMAFVKSGIPTAGKHKDLKWNARDKAYQPFHDGKVRFIGKASHEDDVSPEEEAKVLKPCVYKIR